MEKSELGIIYCDMDGVLADFLAGAEKVLGHHFNAPYQENKEKFERKNKIAQTEEFWADLPVMKDALKLWNYIDKYGANVLTAYAEWDENSKKGKIDWVKKHLHLSSMSRFHAVKREDKEKYATSSGKKNVLIDDYEKNIKEFENAGGIGIHHINTKVTIMKLKELGFR